MQGVTKSFCLIIYGNSSTSRIRQQHAKPESPEHVLCGSTPGDYSVIEGSKLNLDLDSRKITSPMMIDCMTKRGLVLHSS